MTSLSIFLCLAGAFFIVALLLVSFSIRIVPSGKRLAVYRLGEYLGDKGPGIVILIPFIDRGVIKTFDMADETSNRNQ